MKRFFELKSVQTALIAAIIVILFSQNIIASLVVGVVFGFLHFIIKRTRRHAEIMKDAEDEK